MEFKIGSIANSFYLLLFVLGFPFVYKISIVISVEVTWL